MWRKFRTPKGKTNIFGKPNGKTSIFGKPKGKEGKPKGKTSIFLQCHGSKDGCGQNQFGFDPILVGIGEFTTHFRLPILVVGLNRMFTVGTIWILTHGQVFGEGGVLCVFIWMGGGGPRDSRCPFG